MRNIIITIILMIIVTTPAYAVHSESDVGIELTAPSLLAVTGDTRGHIFISKISDNREFKGPDSETALPSWGSDGTEGRADDMMHRAVGRAVWRGGRKGGNVIIENSDILALTRGTLEGSFRGMGFDIVAEKADTISDIIEAEIEILNFWAYFKQAIAGGSVTADIEVLIRLRSSDRTRIITIKVSDNRWAYNPRNPSNWGMVFTSALENLMNSAVEELKKAF